MAAALIVVVVLALPIVGAAIGSAKGHAVLGAFLGLFFGPLGWLIALIIGPSRKIRYEEYAAWSRSQQVVNWQPVDPPGWS